MLRPIATLAALALSAAAFAQTTTTTPGTTTVSPATQQVQLLAPQLVPFAGSSANFDSLVTGLTSGIPVTLTTLGTDGLVQIATFVAGTTLTALDAARTLEAARQNLITRGIATPTAQQLAVALMGGTLSTSSGAAPLAGVITGTTAPGPIQVRNEIAAGPTVGTTGALNLSAANLQALRTALGQGTSVTLSSTGSTGVAQDVTFTSPRGPMNAFEVNQALQLASSLLAQQGIVNPTAEQIRVALVGGTLTTTAGGVVPLQGVLQGSVRNTSDSPLTTTSASPFFGTSNSPASTLPSVTPPPVVPNPTATSTVEGVRRQNTAEGAARRAGR